MYANLTTEQKAAIRQNYQAALQMGTTPVHATAIAANAVLNKTPRALGGKTGANNWAATLAVLVFAGDITVMDTDTRMVECMCRKAR